MSSVLRQISEIQGLTLGELRERWETLYGTAPPRYSWEHLVRRLAYRIQELRFGGLCESTKATLRAVAERDGTGDQVKPLVRRNANDGGPVPGTRLVRVWHGERHEVTVTADGYEYKGRIFRSLTAVAKIISGAHWSGNLFFGLRSRRCGTR